MNGTVHCFRTGRTHHQRGTGGGNRELVREDGIDVLRLADVDRVRGNSWRDVVQVVVIAHGTGAGGCGERRALRDVHAALEKLLQAVFLRGDRGGSGDARVVAERPDNISQAVGHRLQWQRARGDVVPVE